MGQHIGSRLALSGMLGRCIVHPNGFFLSLWLLIGTVGVLPARGATWLVQEGSGSAGVGLAEQDVRELVPGVPIERKLAAGEVRVDPPNYHWYAAEV